VVDGEESAIAAGGGSVVVVDAALAADAGAARSALGELVPRPHPASRTAAMATTIVGVRVGVIGVWTTSGPGWFPVGRQEWSSAGW